MLKLLKEYRDLLGRITVFGGMSPECVDEIVEKCGLQNFKAGDIVTKQGSPAAEIYVILKGKIKIVLDMDNAPLEIQEYGPGECVGEASVIGIQSHSASAVAETDVAFLVLPRQLLMDIMHNNQKLFSLLILNIARELARRLNHTDKMLLDYKRRFIKE